MQSPAALPLAEFAPVRAALESVGRRARTQCPSRSSALCCGRRSCKPTAAEAGAAALLDVQLRQARSAARPMRRAWLTVAERIAAGARSRVRLPPCSVCAARFARSTTCAARQPMSRWVAAWIAAFESGPWALRHRWSSVEYQAAERFRELLAALAAADAFFGTHSRRVGAAHPAARGARHAVSSANRSSADLDQRTTHRPVAELRRLVGQRLRRPSAGRLPCNPFPCCPSACSATSA